MDTNASLNSHDDFTLFCNAYRKRTDSKNILNFMEKGKSGLIKCLINRAFIVCNNWLTFHDEMSKLKDIFHFNVYLMEILDKYIKKLMKSSTF